MLQDVGGGGREVQPYTGPNIWVVFYKRKNPKRGARTQSREGS